MKRHNLFLPVFLCAAVVSCTEKPADNNGGEVEEPDIEVIPVAPTVPSDILSIYELNNGESSVNSCSDTWKNSSLELSYTAAFPVKGNIEATMPHILPDGTLIIVYMDGSTIYSLSGKSVRELSSEPKEICEIDSHSGYPSLSLTNFGGNNGAAGGDNPGESGGNTKTMIAYSDLNNIIVLFSEDNGNSWSEPKTIFTAGGGADFGMRISAVNNNGALQIYYSYIDVNKASTDGINNEVVKMLESVDGGVSWSDYNVAGKKVGEDAHGYTIYAEGNPAAMVLNAGRGIALAMNTYGEDGGVSFAFDESGKWTGDSKSAKYPIDRSDCLFPSCYNPQLCQFRSGETVLGYVESGSKLVLRTGNSIGRNFEVGPENRQLKTNANAGGEIYGARLQDSYGIAAASSHTLVVTTAESVAEYILNHKINASNFTPAIDGNNEDWKGVSEALFLNGGSAQVSMRFAYSDDWFFVLAERLDDEIGNDDSIEFIFQKGDGTGEPFSVTLTPDLENSVLVCSNKAVGLRSNINKNADGKRNGYIAEFGIHRSLLKPVDGRILFNAFIKDNGTVSKATANGNAINSASDDTETCFNGLTRSNYTKWLPIDLKEFVQPDPEPVPDISEIFNEGPSWSTGGSVNPW